MNKEINMNIDDIDLDDLKKLRPDLYARLKTEAKRGSRKSKTDKASAQEAKTASANSIKRINFTSRGLNFGDKIMYGSEKCVVLGKRSFNGSNRLIVLYENGIRDNVAYDKDKITLIRK